MLTIPQIFWEGLLHNFVLDQTNLERVAYFDGVRTANRAIVTTLTIPCAERHRQYFRVSSSDMSAAGQHLLAFGLQRLAQIHTHGDDFLDHSETDDEFAYSQRPGSLSIVIPFHGRGVSNLAQCGVHVREESSWTRLDVQSIAKSIVVVPSSIVLS